MKGILEQKLVGEKIRVAALTGGESVPSARFRLRQYIDALTKLGISVSEYVSEFGAYPPKGKVKRALWLPAVTADAVRRVYKARDSEVVFLQRELVSTYVTAERLISGPVIFDVDDAIWLHKRGGFAGKLAKRSGAVICGNDFIADYFSRFNKRIYVIPTAVDTSRFAPADVDSSQNPVIGWSGTSSNLKQLEWLEPALLKVISKNPGVLLRVTCDRRPEFKSIDPAFVDFIPWSEDAEVSGLRGVSIGIMPLEDNDWSRGKCAFKMLTYMSCGIPVVVSPVGMNRQLLSKGGIGLGASTHQEWADALTMLIFNRETAADMGKAGRKLVETEYSVNVLAPRLANVVREVYEMRLGKSGQ